MTHTLEKKYFGLNKAERQDLHTKNIVITMSKLNSNLNLILNHSNYQKNDSETSKLRQDLEKTLNCLGTTTLLEIEILNRIQSLILTSKKSLINFRKSLNSSYHFEIIPETIEGNLSTLQSEINALIQSLN